MSRYNVSGFIALAATKTALILGSAGTSRPRIYGIWLSTDGAPATDVGVEFAIRNATALGTTTAVVPSPVDPADPLAISSAGSNATVEPTYTAGNAGIDLSFNPRATFVWGAQDQLAELVVPNTAARGIGVQILAPGGGAGNLRAMFSFRE